MIRCLTSFITLAAFAAHMVWGCCAHHVHAFETLAHDKAEAAHEESDGFHRHCRQAAVADSRAGEGAPCEHDGPLPNDCDEPDCSFKSQADMGLPADRSVAAFAAGDPVRATFGLPHGPSQVEARYPCGAPAGGGARLLLQTWRL
jgi:hypothetical protein